MLLPEPHVQGAIQLHSGNQFVASQRALTLLAVKTAQAQMAMGEKGAHPQGASAGLSSPKAGRSLLGVWWHATDGNITQKTQDPGVMPLFLVGLAESQGADGVLVGLLDVVGQQVCFAERRHCQGVIEHQVHGGSLGDRLFQQR
jgi:hypothetical protein